MAKEIEILCFTETEDNIKDCILAVEGQEQIQYRGIDRRHQGRGRIHRKYRGGRLG